MKRMLSDMHAIMQLPGFPVDRMFLFRFAFSHLVTGLTDNMYLSCMSIFMETDPQLLSALLIDEIDKETRLTGLK